MSPVAMAGLITCKCMNCRKTFYRYRSQVKGYTFCSRACYNEWRRKNKKPKTKLGKDLNKILDKSLLVSDNE